MVLYLGVPEGSTGSGSGLKSLKVGPQLKVSTLEDVLMKLMNFNKIQNIKRFRMQVSKRFKAPPSVLDCKILIYAHNVA